MKLLLAILLAFGLGCTSIQVKDLSSQKDLMKKICILRNPQVQVDDFLSVMEKEFMQRNIKVSIYENEVAKDCTYRLTYTARRSWDVSTFLSQAEIRITKDNETVGLATYKHSGGFALNKWASTEAKMKPVFEKLLQGF